MDHGETWGEFYEGLTRWGLWAVAIAPSELVYVAQVEGSVFRSIDCEEDPDDDWVCSDADNCPTVANGNQSDSDGDRVGDWCDNCRFMTNSVQGDTNSNCPGWPYSSDPRCGDACDCCWGRVGDANGIGGDEPTLGDISFLIDHLFISRVTLGCLLEADVNQSGGLNPTAAAVTLGDISNLIEYIFISGPFDVQNNPEGTQLPACL